MADLPPKLTLEQALLEQMRPSDAVRLLNECQTTLEDHWRDMSRVQVDAQKVMIDLALRKIAKVLPDKKATDFRVDVDQSKVQVIISRDVAPPAPPAEGQTE